MSHRAIVSLALGLLVVPVAWASVQHRTDQSPGTAEQIAKGEQLFATCAGCHGTEGEGKVGIGPRLKSTSYLSIVSNEFLKRTIAEGRAGTNMIAWGAMYSDEDVDALVALVRSWQTTDGVELDESPLKGDVAMGSERYRDICAKCHGRAGGGYSEAGSGTGIGREAFLDQASNGMLRGVVTHGKDATAMRPFSKGSPVAVANLTSEEIDSVILYLRENAW